MHQGNGNAVPRILNLCTTCEKLPSRLGHFTSSEELSVPIELEAWWVRASFNKKFLHYQTVLKFKEETSKVLHLKHSFAGAETLTVRKIGQIPLKFRNVVFENDGGQSSPSCEKERPTQ